MKKLITMFVSVMLLMAFTANTVSAQPPHAKAYGKHKYYYYPASNVYFDPGAKVYYYNAGASWTSVPVLPPGISVSSGAPRFAVYHAGPNVWADNQVHVVKYKAPKSPKALKAPKAHKPMKMKHYNKHGKKH